MQTTYDRAYGENRWYTTFTISNAIGQGEVLATPIQLANMAAAIGNRGYYYTPHIIKTYRRMTPFHSNLQHQNIQLLTENILNL